MASRKMARPVSRLALCIPSAYSPPWLHNNRRPILKQYLPVLAPSAAIHLGCAQATTTDRTALHYLPSFPLPCLIDAKCPFGQEKRNCNSVEP